MKEEQPVWTAAGTRRLYSKLVAHYNASSGSSSYQSLTTIVRQTSSPLVISESAAKNATGSTKDILHPDSSHHRLPTLVLVIIVVILLTGLVLSTVLIVRRRFFLKQAILPDCDDSWEVDGEVKDASTLVRSDPDNSGQALRVPASTKLDEGPDSIHAVHQRNPSRAQSIAPSVFLSESAGRRNTLVADDSISVVWEQRQKMPR